MMMKVSELIALLQKLPQHLPVFCREKGKDAGPMEVCEVHRWREPDSFVLLCYQPSMLTPEEIARVESQFPRRK